MAAWGERAFQNDAALDWLKELRAGGLDVLRRTLTDVALTGELHELDADDGAAAIAAAELVAAAFGFGRGRVPQEAHAWLDANQHAFNAADLRLAKRAVRRVLAPNSELSALWDDGGGQNAWHADVSALLSFVWQYANTASTASTANPANPAVAEELTTTLRSSAPPRFVGEREKQIIVTFLEARGLHFTPEQRQRLTTSENLEQILRWLGRAVTATSVAEVFED
jgi:hypothetical protein